MHVQCITKYMEHPSLWKYNSEGWCFEEGNGVLLSSISKLLGDHVEGEDCPFCRSSFLHSCRIFARVVKGRRYPKWVIQMSKDSVDVTHCYGMCFQGSIFVPEKVRFAVPQQFQCVLLGIIPVLREPKFTVTILQMVNG